MILVELAAVIGIMAMLFAIVIGLFASVYRVERSWRETGAERRELQRLAAYFRQDAHRAAELRIAADDDSCSFLISPGHVIQYRIQAGGIERSVERNDEREAASRKQQIISLPEGASVLVQQSRLAARQLATLVVTSQPRGGQPPLMRVDAVLGTFATESQHVEPVDDKGNST